MWILLSRSRRQRLRLSGVVILPSAAKASAVSSCGCSLVATKVWLMPQLPGSPSSTSPLVGICFKSKFTHSPCSASSADDQLRPVSHGLTRTSPLEEPENSPGLHQPGDVKITWDIQTVVHKHKNALIKWNKWQHLSGVFRDKQDEPSAAVN